MGTSSVSIYIDSIYLALMAHVVLSIYFAAIILAKRLLRKALIFEAQVIITGATLVLLLVCMAHTQTASIRELFRLVTGGDLEMSMNSFSWLGPVVFVSQNAAGTLLSWFLFAYCAVALVCVAGLFMRHGYIIRRLRHSLQEMEDEGTLLIFTQCKEEAGVGREVRVACARDVSTPMLYGLLKPTIMLPLDISCRSEDVIRYVLLHELCHIKRWHMLFTYMLTGLQVLFWVNPVVVYFLAETRIELEMDCDVAVPRLLEGAAGRMRYGETVLSYARVHNRRLSLMQINELCNTPKAMERRIDNIIAYRPERTRKNTASTMLLLLVLLLMRVCAPTLEVLQYSPDSVEAVKPGSQVEMLFAADWQATENVYRTFHDDILPPSIYQPLRFDRNAVDKAGILKATTYC